MYITICKIDNQSQFNEMNRAFKPVLWDNPEGWGGEGGRKGVQDEGTHMHPWLLHVDVWQN